MGRRKGGLTEKGAKNIAANLVKSKPSKQSSRYDPDEKDDLERFDEDRDAVLLRAAGEDSGSDSDGEDGVMGIAADDDDSLDSGSDSEGSDSDSDSGSEGSDEERGWGSKKSYYKGDIAEESDSDEDDEMRAEEEEAMRLQKQKRAVVADDDFGVDKDAAKPKKEKKQKAGKQSDAALLSRMNDELSMLDGEKVTRDLSGMSDEAKLEIITADSPELLQLMGDFKAKINQVRESVEPVLRRVKDGAVATDAGVSYLEAKHHLMLSYCINIAFYMMLKASGKEVKSHPVIEQLVRTRALLEKMRPVDKKLKSQLDRLVRQAHAAEEGGAGAVDEAALKPNMAQLVGKDADDSDGDDGDDATTSDAAGLYKMPRMTATQYEEETSTVQKKKKREEKTKQKALKSKMFSDLRAQYSERPEEVGDITGWKADMGQDTTDHKDRQRYEEDNFTRLMVTKKMKKQDSKNQRPRTGLEDITDFSDMAAVGHVGSLASNADDDINSVVKRKSLAAHLNKVDNERKRLKRKLPGGDDDSAYIEKNAPKAKKRAQVDVEGSDVFDADANDFMGGKRSKQPKEDRAYTDAKAARSAKKDKKASEYAASREVAYDDGTDDADGKRAIGRQIEKNKGLMASRKKEVRNPRIKYKNKYMKAVQKRKSTVKEFVPGQADNDGGTANLRTTITRGRKL